MPQTVKGVFTATLTPLNADGSVDYGLLKEHCDQLITSGANGIALMGTTGEANAFSWRERTSILEHLVYHGFEASQLIVGTGCCSLDETAFLSKHATALGVGGVLIMPPFYYRQVADDGLYRYFADLIDATADSTMRVYLYHFPKMSGVHLSTSVVSKLRESYGDTIAGMKDSSGDITHMREVLTAIPGFGLFAGNETFLPDVLALGGPGCITATGNMHVELIATVYREVLNGGVSDDAFRRMLINRKAFEGHILAASLKGVLSRTSGIPSWNLLRPPVLPLDSTQIDAIMDKLQVLDT